MAKDNIEVEIKLKISESRFRKVRKKIKRIGKFIKKLKHEDLYYIPAHRNFLRPKYPYEWLSLRKRGGKTLLNYKHWYPEGARNTTHSDEYDVEVSNPNQLEKLLKVLDFKKIATVSKMREVYEYNGEFEIALDKVFDLGYYIEVESTANKGGVKKAHESILHFISYLGLQYTHTVPGGYAAEVLRQKGLLKP